jgi:hypothetical protein
MKLTAFDKEEILRVIKRAKDARIIYRANALNLRAKGFTLIEVADILEISPRTVSNIEDCYSEFGLERALHDDPRPGAPQGFDDRTKSQIVALVCADPPEGFDRWTLRLIQERVVKMGIAKSISHETVRVILEEHDLKPWQQASWCIPELDDEFIERMEDVLEVYERPHNPRQPVVCLDEKPVTLRDDVRPPSGMIPGEIKRVDYEYERNGTANVFCAIEPKVGKYFLEVTARRTANDFAKCLNRLAARYAEADKIILILDNLNIHCKKSVVSYFGPESGEALWNRFEVHYTPKHGSWLNQAEIAINMYSRQCLGKGRIPSLEALSKKTKAWTRITNKRKVTIQWRFTKNSARKNFGYS